MCVCCWSVLGHFNSLLYVTNSVDAVGYWRSQNWLKLHNVWENQRPSFILTMFFLISLISHHCDMEACFYHIKKCFLASVIIILGFYISFDLLTWNVQIEQDQHILNNFSSFILSFFLKIVYSSFWKIVTLRPFVY